MSADRSDLNKKIRDRIQATIDQADRERKRDLFRKRISLARSGIAHFKNHKVKEAAQAFHLYIRILEDWKNVPEGGLSPALFDKEKDLPELLLLSGVYWDLAKMYDRTRSKEKYQEFMHYLNKFVLFSKGMPFHALSAETMRKYVWNEKPIHKKEFREAYRRFTGNKCFVATSLIDVCDAGTVTRLKRFRDDRLSRTVPGRAAIRFYYGVGPVLARWMDGAPDPVRRGFGRCLDRLAASLDSATSSRDES